MVKIELSEWESKSIRYSDNEELRKSLDDPIYKDIAENLSKSRKLKMFDLRCGFKVEATSYVGRVSFGNVQITIKPKLTGAPLPSLLQYAYNLKNLELIHSTKYTSSDNTFQDILVAQLLLEVRELFSRGIYRKYVYTEKFLESPKGKIDLQKIAYKGLIDTKLPCIYNARSKDCLTNQTLMAGLNLASQVTDVISLKTECRRFASFFADSVSRIRLDSYSLRQLDRESSRLTAAYRPAITIIRILLESGGINLENNSSRLNAHGFLFDMNIFFQALIARFLRENLPKDYLLQEEYCLKGMMSYVEDYNPRNKKPPLLRPDYVIKKDSNVVAVLDAKYRDLWENNLPSKMLYQLVVYSLSQGKKEGKATILYPTLNGKAEEARIQINGCIDGKENYGQVILRPVNLELLNKHISRGSHEYEKRQGFAKSLAFGKD